MDAIFLSASVPVPGRGHYHETANPFLIQCAVRELFISVIRTHRIVWGGQRIARGQGPDLEDIDYARLFHASLGAAVLRVGSSAGPAGAG